MVSFSYFDDVVSAISGMGDDIADGSHWVWDGLSRGAVWVREKGQQAVHDAGYQLARPLLAAAGHRQYQQVHDEVVTDVSPDEMGAAFNFVEALKSVEEAFDVGMREPAGTAAQASIEEMRKTKGFDQGVESIHE